LKYEMLSPQQTNIADRRHKTECEECEKDAFTAKAMVFTQATKRLQKN